MFGFVVHLSLFFVYSEIVFKSSYFFLNKEKIGTEKFLFWTCFPIVKSRMEKMGISIGVNGDVR